jgi:hypothetical protein
MQSTRETQATGAELRSFRRQCLMFIVPLLILTAPALAILIASGESFVDVDQITNTSPKEPILVGFAYNEQHYGYLKHLRLASLPRQSVVALGSSRVLGFREEMFDSSFFNAGYTIVSPWDFRTFLSEIPNHKLPRVLILGLDQFMFSRLGNTRRTPKASTAWTAPPQDDLNTAMRRIPDVYKDLVRGRISVSAVIANATGADTTNEATPVGLNALINRKGMRNDGSFLYSSQVQQLMNSDPAANDYQFAKTLARVKYHGRRFEAGSEVDPEAVTEIGRLLEYCKANAVSVVAFLPPYTDAVWQAMQDSGNYAYMPKIQSELQTHFDQYGFELYAFHRMSDCNSSDQEAIDGFHAEWFSSQQIRRRRPASARRPRGGEQIYLVSGTIASYHADCDDSRDHNPQLSCRESGFLFA